MKKMIKSIHKHISITKKELVKKVNDKCLTCLGYKVVSSISQTIHYKVRVLFTNEKVLNFATFAQAVEYLNVVYNLKLVRENEEKLEVVDDEKEDISNLSVAKRSLRKLIIQFQTTNDNSNLNIIAISDYLDSTEWKKYKFTKIDIDDIIKYLYSCKDIYSTRYIKVVNNMIATAQ